MIGYGNSVFLRRFDSTGITPPPALLLDTYPNAKVAYSLRKLRTAYTGAAIRVRRSSDNAEQDINFVGGDLDTSSLLTFCGAGNGFITTWYDQSTNANNANQPTLLTSQAQIVSAGTVITDPITNKISTIWTNDAYSITTSFAPVQQNTQIAVFNRTALGQRILNLGSGQSVPFIGYWNNVDAVVTSYGSIITHGTSAATGIFLQTVLGADLSSVYMEYANTIVANYSAQLRINGCNCFNCNYSHSIDNLLFCNLI
jgi:hypothetical protein